MIEILLALASIRPQQEVEVARRKRTLESSRRLTMWRLLDFVRRPTIPMSDQPTRTLGTQHGVPVVVSYTCSDWPNNKDNAIDATTCPWVGWRTAGGTRQPSLAQLHRDGGCAANRTCIPSVNRIRISAKCGRLSEPVFYRCPDCWGAGSGKIAFHHALNSGPSPNVGKGSTADDYRDPSGTSTLRPAAARGRCSFRARVRQVGIASLVRSLPMTCGRHPPARPERAVAPLYPDTSTLPDHTNRR
jgi:hypothetical protein